VQKVFISFCRLVSFFGRVVVVDLLYLFCPAVGIIWPKMISKEFRAEIRVDSITFLNSNSFPSSVLPRIAQALDLPFFPGRSLPAWHETLRRHRCNQDISLWHMPKQEKAIAVVRDQHIKLSLVFLIEELILVRCHGPVARKRSFSEA